MEVVPVLSPVELHKLRWHDQQYTHKTSALPDIQPQYHSLSVGVLGAAWPSKPRV